MIRPWFVNDCTLSLFFLTLVTILSMLLFGLLSLFVEFKYDEKEYDWWVGGLIGGFLGFLIILMMFTCTGYKLRSRIGSLRKKLYARDRNDPEFINGL